MKRIDRLKRISIDNGLGHALDLIHKAEAFIKLAQNDRLAECIIEELEHHVFSDLKMVVSADDADHILAAYEDAHECLDD